MTEIVNLGDIIANYFNQDKSPQETAADLGAIILEIEREKDFYGEHSKRMAELKMLAEVQERALSKMMERSDDNSPVQKVPHLKLFSPEL